MKKKDKKIVLYVRISETNKNFLMILKNKLGYKSLSEFLDDFFTDFRNDLVKNDSN